MLEEYAMRASRVAYASAAAAALGWGAAPARATEFGAHVGPGCQGRDAIPAFERFAGRRLERTVDAYNQSSWKAYTSSIPWLAHCWSGVPIKLTVSVPMFPNDPAASLAAGTAGKYDAPTRQVAETLVKEGLAGTTIRIGWEMNGNWMPWAAAKDPKAFVAYYRRMVRIMRAVPGQRFRFEWTTAVGRHAIAPDTVYPGDDVVDVIGMDVYNEYWSPAQAKSPARFAYLRDQPYGMKWLVGFAARHHKPTAYSEWGSGTRHDGHGAGDDPYFFEQMIAWFKATHPLYASYWEVADPSYDDRLATGLHPKAAAAFRKGFAR